jgi:outer membrane protein assembly factor BamE
MQSNSMQFPVQRFLRVLAGLGATALVLLGGCASRTDVAAVTAPSLIERLTPYKVDIQQGNVVTREQVAQVKPGMPREQVRDLLGSPMLTDVFHARRWDFIYVSARRSGGVGEATRLAVTVHFDKAGLVEKIDAPTLPTENEFVAGMVDRRAAAPKVPVLELTPEQRARLPLPVRSESAALPQPQGPARSYPPLEPR